MNTRQARQITGQSESTVYRLAEGGVIKSRRPTPKKWEYELGGLQANAKQILDPEHWERNPKLANALGNGRR